MKRTKRRETGRQHETKKKGKNKITRLEKFIFTILLTLVVGTPIVTLTLTTIQLSYDKELAAINDQVDMLRSESKELETKKQERLTYDYIKGVADSGGLSARQDSVKSVI